MLIPLGILDYPTGETGAYDLLETQVLTSSAASVTFTGLGSYTDYKHLQVRAVTRTDRSGSNAGIVNLIFNGDTTTSYRNHQLFGNGSSVFSGYEPADVNIRDTFRVSGSTSAANSFGAGVLDILDFADTSKNTTIRSLSGSTDYDIINLSSGAYFKTDAITSMTFSPEIGSNIVADSRFSLYGIKAA